MLIDADALGALEELVEEPLAPGKAAPRLRLTPRRIAQWVAESRFRHLGAAYRHFANCERLGRTVARRQERAFTNDMLRQGLTLALIRQDVDLSEQGEVSVVIGDGSGMMLSLLLLAQPGRKVIAVNLVRPLLLDLMSVHEGVPGAQIALARDSAEMAEALASDEVNLVAVTADNAQALAGLPIGLAVTVLTLQEMEPPVIAAYFDLLRSSIAPRVDFYCCNKLSRRLGDGTELRFQTFPWLEGDEILVDEVCPWASLIPFKRPVFWRGRRGDERVIWHRLARLQKG